jgi:hypothetical protein
LVGMNTNPGSSTRSNCMWQFGHRGILFAAEVKEEVRRPSVDQMGTCPAVRLSISYNSQEENNGLLICPPSQLHPRSEETRFRMPNRSLLRVV